MNDRASANDADDQVAPTPAQAARRAATGCERSVDIHCHCLPALDDGPADLEESLALCQALVNDGITSVIATPHQLGRYDLENSSEKIRERVDQLQSELHVRQIPLEIAPGGDVRIDERLPTLIQSRAVCTARELGRHVLLELPHSMFCDPRPLIAQLAADGIQCIMTHPERHRYLGGSLDVVAGWIGEGAVVQVTAGSLTGDFGRSAFDYAWRLLSAGLVTLVATDAHDARRRPPRMTAAMSAISQQLGDNVATTLCVTNPLEVWNGG